MFNFFAKMFSRLERAYFCCQVRTGALAISVLFGMLSVVSVMIGAFELAGFDDGVAQVEATLSMEAELGSDEGLNQVVGIVDAYKGMFRRLLEFGLVFAIGEFVINVLLIFGLAQRKHVACLPWLIYNGFGLVIWGLIMAVVVIAMWVAGAVGSGFLYLFLSGLLFSLYLYTWRIVQSEWMNIKDLDAPSAPQVQVESGNPPPYKD